MPPIHIPDPLPPAISLPRTVVEFAIDEDLAEFGDAGLVARTWQWILHGGCRAPISHTDWSQFDGDGPPSAATLAAESTADRPPLASRTPWAELNKARFLCWWCTAGLSDEVPQRYRAWDSVPSPGVIEDGAITVTAREARDS